MASCFGSTTEDKILQLSEAAVPKNNKYILKQLFTEVEVISTRILTETRMHYSALLR